MPRAPCTLRCAGPFHPSCTGCLLDPSSPAPASLPDSAASPSPSRHSSVLAPPPLLLILPVLLSFSSCTCSLSSSSCSSIREGGRLPVGPRCPARPDPPSPYCLVSSVHPAPVLPDPIPAQSTLRSGVASHCVPSGATLSSLLPDSLYRYWGPTRPCSLGNPAMGSCDLDRDLRPLPFLFLPMTSSFRCLAVARLSGSSRSNKHDTAARGAERTAKIAFPFQSRFFSFSVRYP